MSETNPFTQVPTDLSVHVLSATAAVTSAIQDKWATSGITVRGVRGREMRTTKALFNEVSAAPQFPGYFGENWDAFDDCICDLDWLLPTPGIIREHLRSQERPLASHRFPAQKPIRPIFGEYYGDAD